MMPLLFAAAIVSSAVSVGLAVTPVSASASAIHSPGSGPGSGGGPDLLLVLSRDETMRAWKQLNSDLEHKPGSVIDDDLLYIEGSPASKGSWSERDGDRQAEIKQRTDERTRKY